jgi:DNA-directed RNA polymerase specialized sigma24 family protein
LSSKPTTPASSKSPGIFVTTQWTRVLATRGDSPEARQALSDLCAAYYTPVFVLMRRAAPSEEAARDLTHEFFARLLARAGLGQVDRERGRFRYFLLGAVKHFLADVHDEQCRQKRGGGRVPISLDAGTDSSPAMEVADTSRPSPELEFDREWAVTLLARALDRLGCEQAQAGNGEQFPALKPWLTGDKQDVSLADLAVRLGTSEGALRVALHRLRKRFRELVKEEIAGTVGDSTHVREEMGYLLEVLSRG